MTVVSSVKTIDINNLTEVYKLLFLWPAQEQISNSFRINSLLPLKVIYPQ